MVTCICIVRCDINNNSVYETESQLLISVVKFGLWHQSVAKTTLGLLLKLYVSLTERDRNIMEFDSKQLQNFDIRFCL
jgi:hypothetical protein